MNSKKTIIFTISVFLFSCKSEDKQYPVNVKFPLVETSSFDLKSTIENVAVSDAWMAIQTSDSLRAIDINSLTTLWEMPFRVDNSMVNQFLIIEDSFLVAASKDEINLIDKAAKVTAINLSSSEEDVWKIIAVYPGYLYVLRGPNWILEAYDIDKNILLWKAVVGRGGTNVFYDSNSKTAYVTTRDNSIRAFDNSTGAVLWKQDGKAIYSAFEAGILYFCETTNVEDTYQISAMDVFTQKVLWRTKVEDVDAVYKLTLYDNLLVVSTRRGIIALDKYSAVQIWHSISEDAFLAAPSGVNGVLYVKGASHTVYGINPNTGDVVGYIMFEGNSIIQPSFEARGELYSIPNGIAFFTGNKLFFYKAK